MVLFLVEVGGRAARASQGTVAFLGRDGGLVLDGGVACTILSGVDSLVLEEFEEVVEARGEERTDDRS